MPSALAIAASPQTKTMETAPAPDNQAAPAAATPATPSGLLFADGSPAKVGVVVIGLTQAATPAVVAGLVVALIDRANALRLSGSPILVQVNSALPIETAHQMFSELHGQVASLRSENASLRELVQHLQGQLSITTLAPIPSAAPAWPTIVPHTGDPVSQPNTSVTPPTNSVSEPTVPATSAPPGGNAS